ncbi:hypothetical protein C7B77_01915 [Chamaesiphon polymorphus CCALA 037]|uniref:Uncharacterized protein n=1 Tax=Chamaesiphon polymorphus CCALA 037 TaxID=2107692 RepID=A0A2T1GMP3_9CYAN|nr:hypothetical protein C7B77_01915 [Chamaesiphon polymorphus CCALA 037]
MATIATTFIALLTPQASRAQSAFGKPFPSSGYSSATIYVPSIPQTGGYLRDRNMMRSDPFSPNVYPNRNSFPGLPGTPYYGSSYPNMRFVPSPPPKVVLPEQTFYGGKFYNNCTTRIIGSSIPRSIPVDRYTGKSCF